MRLTNRLIALASTLAMLSSARCDLVEMLDGRRIDGKILKGTESEIVLDLSGGDKKTAASLLRDEVHAVTIGSARIVINGTGLVGAWSFDSIDGDVVEDDSGNQRQVTLKQGATAVPGRHGGGCRFDGANGHAFLAAEPALDNLEAVTYMAWVLPERDSHWHVVDKGDGDKRIYAMGRNLVLSGHVRYQGQHAHADSVADTLVLGEWQHVAMTWSTRDHTIRLYHNGSEVPYAQQTAGTGGVKDDTRFPYALGARGALGKASLFLGTMDDFRIYERLLGSEEIRAIYDAEKDEPEERQ